MLWADLLDALSEKGYRPLCLENHDDQVYVSFSEAEHARLFAGSLMAWGIARKLQHNYVNAVVSFPEHCAPRILEIL